MAGDFERWSGTGNPPTSQTLSPSIPVFQLAAQTGQAKHEGSCRGAGRDERGGVEARHAKPYSRYHRYVNSSLTSDSSYVLYENEAAPLLVT
ncbi:hypothetical protein FH972_021964 [Carpinus fangiana]|uniref:Uncharacterized protein n=1 Tax=Carpinus fangiana TaxID=176857 RepID=A0A5N6KR77_9ROSI|nr:hypothetical protein FH972_021964 [Carpinus fangiana]